MFTYIDVGIIAIRIEYERPLSICLVYEGFSKMFRWWFRLPEIKVSACLLSHCLQGTCLHRRNQAISTMTGLGLITKLNW